MSIDQKKDTVLVNVNTKIYKIESLLKVAQSFSEVCWVNVDGDVDGEVQIRLKPKSKDIKTKNLGYEFLNHVLAEMEISEDI